MPFSDLIGHEEPKKKLRTALSHETIGHAYLFSGVDGIGKRLMAVRFAQALSCESPQSSALPDSCGQCRACSQIEANLHPDFITITPEEDKANPQIKIERIRDIEHHVIYRPFMASRKICLIDDADRLTTSAANALLKTLEDPPDHSLFILISSRPALLPATVRSRCLLLRFTPATQHQTEGALVLKQAMDPQDARFLAVATGNRIGASLSADVAQTKATLEHFFDLWDGTTLASASSTLSKAEALAKSEAFSDLIAWLVHGLRDLLLVTVDASPEHLLHQDRLHFFQSLSHELNPEQVLAVIDALLVLEQAPTRNQNIQLLLENFFMQLRDMVQRQAA